MSGPEFFQTLMGHKFYERDFPELVRQLARLNDNLERIAVALPRIDWKAARLKREKCELPPGKYPPDRGDGICVACGYAVEDH